ncbi:recombinase family protein [Ferrovibrio sp.]|uniref:recombinase family protein n=1 Tax=Ferrovibrio sp. TaxID=1917215 RepID=UPI0035B2CAF6
MRAVAYYRVSTDRQGRSGLGLEAQKTAVQAVLRPGDQLIAEFTEVESGKRRDRPKLAEALRQAKVNKAALVVAKVDRLARNVHFLETILGGDVEVVFADLPQVSGPMGRFILQQLAAVAQLEAGLISERTKAALAAAKQRGVKLGGFKGVAVDTKLGTQALIEKADERARDFALVISDIRASGISGYTAIAATLNARGIPTARGGSWQASQVRRVLSRVS